MRKNKINLILIISILLLILVSFSFVFLLNIIKNKNNHISAVSITLGEKIAEKKNLSILENKMTELTDTRSKISDYLVDTSNIDKFVEYLEGVGASNNLELSVDSVDIVKDEKNKIAVKLTTKGGFLNTMKNILILENSPYNIVIKSLYLNKNIESSSTDTKTISVSSKSFWQMDMSFNVLSL